MKGKIDMRRIRNLFSFLSILLVLPLALPLLGVGGAWAPVQVQLLGATTAPAAAQGDPQRIQFAPGSTSATVHGSVAPGATDQYVLHASAGQTLTVQITTGQGQVVVTITGADGKLLVTDYVGHSTFSGVLPTSQDYTIGVQATGQATADYTLGITIPAASSSPPPAGALRIQFAAGATSATVQGDLPPQTIGHYVIRAAAGQTMTIQTSATQGQVVVIVYGADGTVLQSDHAGASGFSGTLPASQDYLIDLRSVGQVAAVFSMTVTIPPTGSGSPPPVGAKRILFAPGATSATEQGDLVAGGSQQYYVRVQAGQILIVVVDAQHDVAMSVRGANGTVLQGSGGPAFFRGVVPTSQDYIVTVTAGAEASAYNLTVTVPERICLPARTT
jgi:hypothetical protein